MLLLSLFLVFVDVDVVARGRSAALHFGLTASSGSFQLYSFSTPGGGGTANAQIQRGARADKVAGNIVAGIRHKRLRKKKRRGIKR